MYIASYLLVYMCFECSCISLLWFCFPFALTFPFFQKHWKNFFGFKFIKQLIHVFKYQYLLVSFYNHSEIRQINVFLNEMTTVKTVMRDHCEEYQPSMRDHCCSNMASHHRFHCNTKTKKICEIFLIDKSL